MNCIDLQFSLSRRRYWGMTRPPRQAPLSCLGGGGSQLAFFIQILRTSFAERAFSMQWRVSISPAMRGWSRRKLR